MFIYIFAIFCKLSTIMEKLESEYYNNNDKSNSWNFLHSSSKTLYNRFNKKYKQFAIKEFLKQQKNYTLFRQTSGNQFKRDPYRVYFIDECWEVDLMSLPTSYARYNSGYTYILTCIDLFSRYAFVRCLQTKQPREVIRNLVDIFQKSNRKPRVLQTDAGGEFVNTSVDAFLKHQQIQHRIPNTTLPAKNAIVERFNRTLKSRIVRYLNFKHETKQKNEKRCVDDIQILVDDYNRTQHSIIGVAPTSVTKANAVLIYHNLRMKNKMLDEKNKKLNNLKENDFVRIKKKTNNL